MMTHCQPASIPRLLVSVRNSREARTAVAGGCNILDIKEPRRGSLGMADPAVMAKCASAGQEAAAARRRAIPLTAALGEVGDWIAAASVPVIPRDLDYVKLGLAGIGNQADWPSRWRQVRQRFEQAAGGPLNWIAVVYADHRLAEAPHPREIIEAALSEGCRGVLFDTYCKNGTTLLDCLPVEQILSYSDAIRQENLLLALAGSLRSTMLHNLAGVSPDIVAVRGAVCNRGSRLNEVTTEAVASFRTTLAQVFIRSGALRT